MLQEKTNLGQNPRLNFYTLSELCPPDSYRYYLCLWLCFMRVNLLLSHYSSRLLPILLVRVETQDFIGIEICKVPINSAKRKTVDTLINDKISMSLSHYKQRVGIIT